MARTKIQEDLFNRADGPIGSNWSYIRETTWTATTPSVASNVLRANATGDHYQVVRWNGSGTFSNDQYAKVTIVSAPWNDVNYRFGVVVRCSADLDTNADFYMLWVALDGASNRTTKLVKVANGTETTLDTRTVAWSNGDTISIEVDGSSTTTLRAYKNDIEVYSVTDSSSPLTTGKPGLMIAGDTAPTIDSWEGGDVTAGGTTHTLTGSNCTQTNTSTSGAISASSGGTLTTPPLKNNTGTVLSNETDVTAFVYNVSTGALVVSKTGQTTNSSGIMTITDAAIAASTQYRVVVVLSSGAEGLDKLTAS